MASGFIILEDGRCWARRWTFFDAVIEKICERISDGDNEFKVFLESALPNENDIEMGWGFIRDTDKETVVRTIDLREFAPLNRILFWKAAQTALAALYQNKKDKNSEANETLIFGLQLLLKMHKRITKGESPNTLTDWREGYSEPETGNKKGPGWETISLK